jgi:hypothetical protein
MPGIRRAAQALLVLAASAAAVLPRPETTIERLYGVAWYPAVQAAVTGASNHLPLAVFDATIVCVVAVCVWWWARAVRALWRRRLWAPAGRAAAATLTLWFLAVGPELRASPVEQRLGLRPGAPADVTRLLDRPSLGMRFRQPHRGLRTNRMYDDVARALHAEEARHGRPRPTVPGTPKPTLLASYFRMAGVDGLTAPAALETLLNPDLTAPERPFVLAHEWAHLSGYAPEADANFIAWLVTQEPGTSPRTAYSGWLFLVSEAARQVPAATRRASLAALAAGPRQDLADIATRMASRVDLVERVGWRVYDSYLRSQGVEEGVRSYSRVIELIVGARRAADRRRCQ